MTNTQETIHSSALLQKIQTKQAKIGVIGLGYVGLPQAVHYSKKGYEVTGIDNDLEKLTQLKLGHSYVDDVADEDIRSYLRTGSFTSETTAISQLDVIFIAVPTPIDAAEIPDLACLEAVSCSLLTHCRPGQLIILESTSYPSTTEKFLVDPLQKRGLIVGEDIFVAFSPERVDPGNQQYNLDNTPRLIGGSTELCSELAAAIIGQLAVKVSSPMVAEMAKLYENTFRFANIALANELSHMCHALDISTNEVLNAAATKPFGFMKFTPNIKIGGHCIGVDPYYLRWYMNQRGIAAPMVDTASKVDQSMRQLLLEKIHLLLNQAQVPAFAAKIAVLGVSYKKNIRDTRMSATTTVVRELLKYQMTFQLFDSYHEVFEVDGHSWPVAAVDYESLSQYDLVLILTDHDSVDYDQVQQQAAAVLDTKGIKPHLPAEKWYTL